jgi:hypothetical protein
MLHKIRFSIYKLCLLYIKSYQAKNAKEDIRNLIRMLDDMSTVKTVPNPQNKKKVMYRGANGRWVSSKNI